jgi:hypothetical protein
LKMSNDEKQKKKELLSLISSISEGTGDIQKNIEAIKTFGEMSLVEILNADLTHIPDSRDIRDSLHDIKCAFTEVAQVHLEAATELFKRELLSSNEGTNNKLIMLAGVFEDLYHDELLPVLELGIKHNSKWVRLRCCESLRKSKAPKALPLLSVALKDRVLHVKHCAIEAMGEFGTPEQIPNLIELQKSKDRSLKGKANRAIAQIESREN